VSDRRKKLIQRNQTLPMESALELIGQNLVHGKQKTLGDHANIVVDTNYREHKQRILVPQSHQAVVGVLLQLGDLVNVVVGQWRFAELAAETEFGGSLVGNEVGVLEVAELDWFGGE